MMMQELLEESPQLQEDEWTIVSTRVFHAPREMVYEAFADPKQVVEWWGPHGFTITILRMDLRSRGKWSIVMHAPDGTNHPNEMRFTAFIPSEHIALKPITGGQLVHMHKTITWQDENGGTRLTLGNHFVSRELHAENVRTYEFVKGDRDRLERLTKFLHTKGVA